MSEKKKARKFTVGKLVKINGRSYVVTQLLGDKICCLRSEVEGTPEQVAKWKHAAQKIRVLKKGFMQMDSVPGVPYFKSKVDEEEDTNSED